MPQAYKPICAQSESLHTLFALVFGHRVSHASAYEFGLDSVDTRARVPHSASERERTSVQNVRILALGAEDRRPHLLVNQTVRDDFCSLQRTAIVKRDRFGQNGHGGAFLVDEVGGALSAAVDRNVFEAVRNALGRIRLAFEIPIQKKAITANTTDAGREGHGTVGQGRVGLALAELAHQV